MNSIKFLILIGFQPLKKETKTKTNKTKLIKARQKKLVAATASKNSPAAYFYWWV